MAKVAALFVHHRFTSIIPLVVLGAVYIYRSWQLSSSSVKPLKGMTMSTVGVETVTSRDEDEVHRKPVEEKKEEGMVVEQVDDCIESADVEPEQQLTGAEAIMRRLWESMNPSSCLSPTTACTQILLEDDDIIEYHNVVPPMLRDMKHPGKSRTTALQKLYRFTDKQHQKNRYVSWIPTLIILMMPRGYTSVTNHFIFHRQCPGCLFDKVSCHRCAPSLPSFTRCGSR